MSVDIAALKEEIKSELLKELHKPGIRIARPWSKVKDSFLPRLDSYGSYHQYHILTAISTLVRYALKLKNVLDLGSDQTEAAKKIANEVIDILLNQRSGAPT